MDNCIQLGALNKKEALRYLGYNKRAADNVLNGDMDKNLSHIIDECEKLVLAAAKPRFVYKIADFETDEKGVILKPFDFRLPGADIKKLLQGCEKAVLMAVTVSLDIDRLIFSLQHTDVTKAVVADSLASVAVEQACDRAEMLIKQTYPQYYQTFRYGIGYGDLPIELQPSFLKLLNAERLIGLTAGCGCMLNPQKSVTAIIGLSENKLEKMRGGCSTCNLKGNCKYRQEGIHCNE